MPAQPEPTPQEHIDFFRDCIHAKAAPKSATILKQGSNILLAAAFHGLARHSKGATDLTVYEKLGVDFLKALAGDDDEVFRGFADVCVEAKTLSRDGNFIAANVPLSVMNLSEDTSYIDELFQRDAEELGKEAVMQPHIRAISSEQIDAEGKIAETPELTAAVKELKRELTVFGLTEGEKRAQLAAPPPDIISAKIETRHFTFEPMRLEQ